jgi:type IV pilus assembly protein PilQ
MLKKWAFVVVLVVCVATYGHAQTQGGAASEAPAGAPSAERSDTSAGNVSLDFRDADIANVLKILSFKSGVNIVVAPEVTGLVTIQLHDVPWKQALEVVLETYGYAFEQKGNIITVTTVENLKQRRENAMLLAEQEPLETKTFTLNFGRASEIIASIDKMKTERGSIDFDERTNTLIITDISKRLELMEGVINALDTTTPQVLIEAKIVETNFVDEENLGIDWLTQATLSGSKRPITYPFTTATSNKFVPDPIPSAGESEFSYGTLDFSQLQVVFELLKTKTDTNILSNPRIVTLDNQAAQIVVGSQYPIPQYTYNEDQARLQVSGWEYMDIGIIFDVTPHVNKAGFVTLDVEPKITAIIGSVTVENTSLPQLSNESTKTRVMVKDGETLVIAGLVKEQIDDTKRKIPLLGDIPWVGVLFQKSEKTTNKTDLMIFITPHIVTPEVAADD